jgi:hypothetical protein
MKQLPRRTILIKSNFCLVVLLLVGGLCSSGRADILLTYPTVRGSGTVAVIDPAQGGTLSATPLSFNGYTGGLYGVSSTGDNIYVRTNATISGSSASPDGSLTGGYLAFTVTPEINQVLSLDSININFGATADSAHPRARLTFTLYSSLDNYASALYTTTYTCDTNQQTFQPTLSTVNFGDTFDGLTSGVTFRVVFDSLDWYDNAVIARIGQGNGKTYGIQLNGTVSMIPEPSVYMLLGAGLLLLAACRGTARQCKIKD